jgi:type I restriction enzyme M protein
MARPKKQSENGNGANLGFEEKLWGAAGKLRGHMDAAEYKHVVLGLIFLKYISDAFQELNDRSADDKQSDAEDRDEYLVENVFWFPKSPRWPKLQAAAKQPTIGKDIDDGMVAIEKDNPTVKGVAGARTCSCASTNTFWANSPAPRARAAANSTRRNRS